MEGLDEEIVTQTAKGGFPDEAIFGTQKLGDGRQRVPHVPQVFGILFRYNNKKFEGFCQMDETFHILENRNLFVNSGIEFFVHINDEQDGLLCVQFHFDLRQASYDYYIRPPF